LPLFASPTGWKSHCCGAIAGMAAALESFYKPELAAHNPRPQATRLQPREMVF
jgi:hypothetical protein